MTSPRVRRRPDPGTLDRQVEQAVQADPRSWRPEITVAVLAIPVLIALLEGAHALWHPLQGVLSIAAELVLLTVMLVVLRRLPRGSVGLDRPRPRDLWTALKWFLLQVLARFGALILFFIVIPPLATVGKSASNVGDLHHLSGLSIALLLVGGCIFAPITEEIAFRGIVLQGLMRTMTFGRSATISSLIFGVLHGYEVNRWKGRVVLVTATAVFGWVQCCLVRRHARLAPAMIVHGSANLAVLLIALNS